MVSIYDIQTVIMRADKIKNTQLKMSNFFLTIHTVNIDNVYYYILHAPSTMQYVFNSKQIIEMSFTIPCSTDL